MPQSGGPRADLFGCRSPLLAAPLVARCSLRCACGTASCLRLSVDWPLVAPMLVADHFLSCAVAVCSRGESSSTNTLLNLLIAPLGWAAGCRSSRMGCSIARCPLHDCPATTATATETANATATCNTNRCWSLEQCKCSQRCIRNVQRAPAKPAAAAAGEWVRTAHVHLRAELAAR